MFGRYVSRLVVLAMMGTFALAAQVKEMPRTPVKTIKPAIVDINSAPEAEIVGVGIDKAVAKKIVDGRPYRNKRDLMTRQLLTKDQYEKVKDSIVAKQPPKK